MKKNLLYIAAIAFSIVGCNKDLVPEVPSGNNEYADISFSAEIVNGSDADTKVTLGAQTSAGTHPVSWTKGDMIWICNPGKSGAAFTAQESSRKSAFRIETWKNDADYAFFKDFATNTYGYYAVSPFIPANYVDASDGWHVEYYSTRYGFVFMNVPAVQYAVEGGCDPDAMVMGGMTKNASDPFKFYSATALLEFTLAMPEGYTANSVEISVKKYTEAQKIEGLTKESDGFHHYVLPTEEYVSNGVNEEHTRGEIAGQRVLFAGEAISWINKNLADKGAYAVTLKNRDESPLKDGATYYIAVWPGQKTGFTLTVNATDSEGHSVTWKRSSSREQVFLKGVVYPLGEIEPVF